MAISLVMLIIVEYVPKWVTEVNLSSVYNRKSSNKKYYILGLKIVKNVLFIVWILLMVVTIIAFIGIFVSDVPVNEVHGFSLIILVLAAMCNSIGNTIRDTAKRE